MKIELRGIEKSFDGRTVLKDISCVFPSGQVSTMVGVSGCGKTTLLRIIAGLENPDRGQVLANGEDITALPPARRKLGFVFQDLGLYGHLTVSRNLRLPLEARGIRSAEALARARKSAEEFGLGDFFERRADTLSGGEAQRLALGKALMRDPQLMLLDEPFGHLDAPLQRSARAFVLSELRHRETSAVLVTHNHQDAQEAGGPVFLMNEGRILQHGSWEELYRRPTTPHVAEVVSFMAPLCLRGPYESNGERLSFRPNATELELEYALNDLPEGIQEDVRSRKSGQLTVYYRSEDLEAEALRGEDVPGALHGKVVATYFQARSRYCQLEHANGMIFSALLPGGLQNGLPDVLGVRIAGHRPLLVIRQMVNQVEP